MTEDVKSPTPDETRKDLGAQGSYPDGKLNEADEGALQFAIARMDEFVVIDFGKSVTWLAVQAHDAKRIGQQLIEAARAVEQSLNDEQK